MRGIAFVATLVFLTVPTVARAQQPPATSDVTTFTGWLDFGVRGSSIKGDSARYERYRDLGDGLFLEDLRARKETGHWLIDGLAQHAGRKDQRFAGSAVRPGRLKISFMWDQVPMLMSRTTQTLYAFSAPGVLTIDDALQAQVQASAAALAGVVENNARTFVLSTRRHVADGAVEYLAHPNLTFRVNFRRQAREGTMPYGGSFGHGNVVETPAPVDHTQTDVEGGAEFARNRVLLRVGYANSSFHNEVTALTFDNPWRAVNTTSAGAAGQFALAPSSSMMSVNGMASVRLPGRSRATAYVSTGRLKDAGAPLLPFTVNPALAVIPLPRDTVNGDVRTTSATVTFTSRPSRYLDVSARFRSYDYDNRTPEFHITRRVAFDNAVSNSVKETEPFGVLRQSFDADLRVRPARILTAGVGFTQLREARTHRIFDSSTENIARAVVDAIDTRWFSLRARFEHGQKRGALDPNASADLAAVGEQPGMRHFDIAERDRNRVTIAGSLTPTANLAVTGSFARGHDDYLQSLFGLRDNRHTVMGAGVDATVGERAAFGVSYSHELYASLSRSRQANPGVQFTDESRNWATDGTDRVHSAMANAEVTKIGGRVDLRFTADWSRARSLYRYITGPVADRTLPEESPVLPSTLPNPTQLPPASSELARATVDVLYALTSRLSVGVSYWFEQYAVSDFTLDAQAIPRVDLPGALLIGYRYLPYTAHTGWARLVLRW